MTSLYIFQRGGGVHPIIFLLFLSLLPIYRACDAFTWWPSRKESACQCRRCGLNPWVRKIFWRRKWLPTHSSIPAWEISWTEEPSRLQSMGLQRVGHDLATKQQNKASGVWQMHVFSWGHPAQLISHYGYGLWFPECEDLQMAWQILSFLVLRYYWDFFTNPSFYRKPQPLPLFFFRIENIRLLGLTTLFPILQVLLH